MNKIDLEITESVRCWVKHSLGPQKKPVEGKITGQWNDRNSETGTHASTSGCVSLRKSKIGFLNPKESENGFCVSLLTRLIQELTDHGASKEPKNLL